MLSALLLLNILQGEKQMKIKSKEFMQNRGILIGLIFIWLILSGLIIPANNVEARDKKTPGHEIGVNGFLDEDGDGFNDLLPDSDGDGVPDALDPDFRGRHGDSLGNRQQGTSPMPDSGGPRHDRNPGEMGPHGEPGMFGPGDTTGHRGIHDGRRGDRGGHGPRGGGDINPDDSIGGKGDGLNPPDSMGHHKIAPGIAIPPTEIPSIKREANPEKRQIENSATNIPETGTLKGNQKESSKR